VHPEFAEQPTKIHSLSSVYNLKNRLDSERSDRPDGTADGGLKKRQDQNGCMDLVGKTGPDTEQIATVANAGFDAVELYLSTDHLDAYEQTRETVDSIDMDIVSVHTPHVADDQTDYIKQTVELADRYDALLLFHSSSIPVRDAVSIGQDLDYDTIAYENHSDMTADELFEQVIDQGANLGLDVAHLYRATAPNQYNKHLPALLDAAVHLHLCDAQEAADNLPPGDGTIPMEQVIDDITASTYDGPVVLEVMPEDQTAMREQVDQYLDG
jgi:sugar phosphate isomerase/epimerase